MSKQVFIGVGAFLVGAYMQKKFDVCGKLENLWGKAQESLKSDDPQTVEDEE
jgi:hypothetical protein